jgi:hypothetical protein
VQHYSQEELGRERYGASGQSLENGRKCRIRAMAERYSTSYGGSRVYLCQMQEWFEEKSSGLKTSTGICQEKVMSTCNFESFSMNGVMFLHSRNTLFCMSLPYD